MALRRRARTRLCTGARRKACYGKRHCPGRGHGSPTVVGDRLYLATADVENQSVLCLTRNTGQRVWETKVHGGQPDPGHHSNSSAASSTLACDGSRLYINFLNDGAVYTSALDLDGKLLWQHKVCDFVTHQGSVLRPSCTSRWSSFRQITGVAVSSWRLTARLGIQSGVNQGPKSLITLRPRS
jgi:hypothetical protein